MKGPGGGIKKVGLWFDDKKIAIGMAIFIVITIIPMLAAARYSHASADDFGWGAGLRRQVWNETHSIIQFVKAAFRGTVSLYYGWQGTFTTTFVQAFQPEIFNINAYFIVPYIMLSFFSGRHGNVLALSAGGNAKNEEIGLGCSDNALLSDFHPIHTFYRGSVLLV